eukprot:TRINITY_DN2353_c0_g1_i1.p1 TRINITY_DN2353_c0_g1~~TRINITY_DN2353_c0_g1_i1.p1  ORF type:complete len:446 (+),score=134.45 TRINITY_DN2353_c0_g1_i1:133-1470(+)
MEQQEIKITIKSNYHGDLRRFVLEGEELNSIYLQLMVSDLYKIPLENVSATVLLDSQRVEVTSDLLRKCTRRGIAILRIDVNDVAEGKKEAPALSSSTIPNGGMLRAECRSQIVELLNSKTFIESIVDRVVPLVQKSLEQAAPDLSKSLLESTINDSIFKSVIQEDEESYEAVSDDDETPSLVEMPKDDLSDSEDENWDSTATETESDTDEEDDVEEDPFPNDVEEGHVAIDEAPQDADERDPKDENSDPEDFQSFEVIKAEEPQPEEPKKESRPIFKSLLAFIKEKTVDRIRPQNEGIKEEDIPNLEELLTRLDEMGFHDREVNIAALRFHRNFKEGLDEVIEDLLSQGPDQNPESKEDPQEDRSIIESNPDAPILDEAPLIEEGREDIREQNDEVIESPQPSQEMVEPKPEMRGRLNSADVQRLVEAGMPKDLAVRTLLAQPF